MKVFDRRMKHLALLVFAAYIIVGGTWADVQVKADDAEEPVHFADPALKAAIEEALGITNPTPTDMLMLDSLDMSWPLGIADLSGMEYAVNLTHLDLPINIITDISPLSGLTKLEVLSLGSNKISDISPLRGLTSLTHLDLEDNNIADLSPLMSLTAIEHLYINNNKISDVSPLTSLVNLKVLRLYANKISDISPLVGLVGLGTLDIRINQISDISPLAGLIGLGTLEIGNNKISDISVISALTGLVRLSIEGNMIDNILPLVNLSRLQQLGISYNPIADISPLVALTNLKYVYADGCEIANISPLTGLVYLETLFISNNHIADLDALSRMKNLRYLDMRSNRISNCDGVAGLVKLEWLFLDDNQVNNIDALSTLTNLQRALLRSNRISDISALSTLTNLQEVYLVGNPLNLDAYCVHIPMIRKNNPVVNLIYDPQPDSFVCPPVPQKVYFVDSQAPGRNDGSSWDHAFHYLQDALEAARYGDEIRVAQGIYKPDQEASGLRLGDRRATFQLKNSVVVKGGYAGVTTQDPNARSVDEYLTILSGDLAENDVGECGDPSMNDNSLHVVCADDVDNGAVLDGFTVTGGMANLDYTSGGGMTISHGSPVIRECRFTHNCALLMGGGIYYTAGDSEQRIINCVFDDNYAGSHGGAIREESDYPQLILENCRVTGNTAGSTGGGISGGYAPRDFYPKSSLVLRKCVLASNSAEYEGEIEHWGRRYNSNWNMEPDLILADLIISPSGSQVATIGSATVLLETDFNLPHGTLDIISSLFEGEGKIMLDRESGLRFAGHWQHESISTLRTSIHGTGRIEIDAGQQLIIEGNAVVSLSNAPGGSPDPDEDGRIVVNGSLLVRGNATIESTNIDVKLFEVDDPNTIQYNNITLLEASTGFGGEFFVGENARIENNNIVSEGDRYLDLDPMSHDVNHPTIKNNRITVIIKEGKLSNQGTLLELRAKDYDAGTAVNPIGSSGAYCVDANSFGYTEDPSENWVLEKLILEPNSKLNLTNRQGFEFQGLDELYPETVYVKDLVMGPNSVLNTALQTMYYQRLVDPNGVELARDPNDPDSPFANGARFVDVPLLGFSLGIIAMNDQTEFDVRVRKRLTDPDDDSEQPPFPAEPLYIGSIERIDANTDPNVPKSTGGVMEMCTQAKGRLSARSVAAKGAFARAGDESITIKFEYLFPDKNLSDAILVVYLSDNPEVGHESRIPVAMIRPPEPGRPGSIQSNRFAVFSMTVPHGDLNFCRGTYVELELYGQNVRCWIDNWDPQIECTAWCGDYNKDTEIDFTDYLLLLAEFGLQDPLGNSKACLDLVYDGCVGIDDLMVWDAASDMTCLCPLRDQAMPNASSSAGNLFMTQTASANDSLNDSIDSDIVLFGKSVLRYNLLGPDPDSYLYNVNVDGTATLLSLNPGTGRLTIDSSGRVYQLFHNEGLVCIDDPQTRIVQKPDLQCVKSDKIISVGFNGSYQKGIPLLDAAFNPSSSNTVYVVPVRVESKNGIPYMAAAKLSLASTGPGVIDYSVETLYGLDPTEDPNQDITILSESARNVVLEPDFQHLKEIGIDRSGTYVFVLSSCWENGNNWMLIYNEAMGDLYGCVNLSQPDDNLPDINAPSNMVISSIDDRIYLASSLRSNNKEDDLTAKVYCLTFQREQRNGGGDILHIESDRVITIEWSAPDQNILEFFADLLEPERYVSVITSMTEAPDGRLCVVGFTAPRFKNEPWHTAPRFFTRPMLAIIEPDTGDSEIYTLNDVDLPLSVVWR